jgi:hypothetical protein
MAEDILAYEVAEGWGRLPKGWAFTKVAGVTVDSRDRVVLEGQRIQVFAPA